jgi:hypothetical protein
MNTDIQPFPNCPALDGYHCQTSSLAKIFHFYNHPVSEEMLLGLGAGMGFMYWHQKGTYPFIGGRGNTKNFFHDIGVRTGVDIRIKSTTSVKKAEAALLDAMQKNEPRMLYGDMGFIPWFTLPESYHFGGHTFVICGYDGNDTFLASDMDQLASGLKKGFYASITKDQLSRARNSPFKPFPPKNTSLEFDFSHYHPPGKKDIYSAIRQTIDQMMNPPISNFGVKGIRRTAKEIMKWPALFNENEVRMCLFSAYIFIEVGGTGGGCFRYMFARFLKEAAELTVNDDLIRASEIFDKSGRMFTQFANQFKDLEQDIEYTSMLRGVPDALHEIADVEEQGYRALGEVIH